jgi:hypothetical protein
MVRLVQLYAVKVQDCNTMAEDFQMWRINLLRFNQLLQDCVRKVLRKDLAVQKKVNWLPANSLSKQLIAGKPSVKRLESYRPT